MGLATNALFRLKLVVHTGACLSRKEFWPRDCVPEKTGEDWREWEQNRPANGRQFRSSKKSGKSHCCLGLKRSRCCNAAKINLWKSFLSKYVLFSWKKAATWLLKEFFCPFSPPRKFGILKISVYQRMGWEDDSCSSNCRQMRFI